MKILAVSDEESRYLWDYFEPEKLDGIDLIVGCGDLDLNYLTFLATVAHVPLIYVHGNHDGAYDSAPPVGGICIDDDVFVYRGVRFAGLGGSCRYREGPWQFTEAEMKKRVRRLHPKLDRAGGLDVLVTHAPLHGCGDFSDLPHRGFETFRELLDFYKPGLMLHGHIHLNYAPNLPREQQYRSTRIVNAYERCIVEVPDGVCAPEPERRPLWMRLLGWG
ncbi:MAG: metallophosphoesterase [Gemmiger sp.]